MAEVIAIQRREDDAGAGASEKRADAAQAHRRRRSAYGDS
jgi:hypothetical protein